jgi:integrative and conjugative element protein (TIGR02256 family)
VSGVQSETRKVYVTFAGGGEPLTYARNAGGRLQISRQTVEVLRRFIQDRPAKKEAGGVLLGRHILDTNDVVVDAVTVPLPGDQRGRVRFLRARQRHQEAIDQAWRDSGGTCTFLGEWHTHPEAHPWPSGTDRQDWLRKLREDEFTHWLFFVIVGTEETRVWEGARNGKAVFRLLQI